MMVLLLTLSEKAKRLEDIANKIRKCTKCELWKNRKNAVPGEGSPDAEIMFIGEAPGYHEDLQGRPFVGAAGKFLTQLIESIGLRREDVYITNVVKCRPPNNRDPLPEEISICSRYLEEQIEIISPKIIVTLGRHSTLYILRRKDPHISGISQVRGRVFDVSLKTLKVKVIPTYHPAAALYNPRLKTIIERDFKFIKTVYTGEYEKIRRDKITLEDFF